MVYEAIVLWFTGMSGAGKSTIAQKTAAQLNAKGYKTCILDGDQVRNSLHTSLTFSRDDILTNNRKISELCLKKINQCDVVFAPVISPYELGRAHAREAIGKNFYEIYVQASLESLLKRDTKGFYEKSRNRKMDNLIGFSKKIPYEKPKAPDLLLSTDQNSPDESVSQLIEKIDHWLKGKPSY